MKDNQIFFFPAVLSIPGLGLLSSGSPETIALGLISFTLLFLFFYTIKLMGGKPGEFHPGELDISDDGEMEEEFRDGESDPVNEETPLDTSDLSLHPENTTTTQPSNTAKTQSSNADKTQSSNENNPENQPNTRRFPVMERSNQPIHKNSIQLEIKTKPRHIPDPLEIQGFRKERFKKETLGPMVKNFIQDLPHKSKIDNVLFSIYEKESFHEFLIQRGRLFIDCDTSAYLEASEEELQELKYGSHLVLDKSRKIILPIFTPSRNYGAMVLESLAGFNEKDILILQSECNRFAIEWETRNEYELAILDPITLVYNKSHYRTILREKFLSHDRIGLFLLDITGSEDREIFISFLAEFHSFPIYRVDERRLAFFLDESEIAGLNLSMESAIRELDKRGFFAEFVLGFSMRTNAMDSVMDWEEDAIQQLYLARKKSPTLENSVR